MKQARRIELKSFAWKATGLRSGVTAIECGLIAAGIGVAILTVVNSVGGSKLPGPTPPRRTAA